MKLFIIFLFAQCISSHLLMNAAVPKNNWPVKKDITTTKEMEKESIIIDENVTLPSLLIFY